MGFDSSAPVVPELEVHNAIRLKREKLGLSKRELGRKARKSAAYVSALEAGNLNPSFSAFSALAMELGFTQQEVFLLVKQAASATPSATKDEGDV